MSKCLGMISRSLTNDSECDFLTFSIVAEAHFSLAKTNCVFALANAIELLKLGLIDTLNRYMSDFCRSLYIVFL